MYTLDLLLKKKNCLYFLHAFQSEIVRVHYSGIPIFSYSLKKAQTRKIKNTYTSISVIVELEGTAYFQKSIDFQYLICYKLELSAFMHML